MMLFEAKSHYLSDGIIIYIAGSCCEGNPKCYYAQDYVVEIDIILH